MKASAASNKEVIEYLSIQDLRSALLEATGDATVSDIYAHQVAHVWRGDIIDAVRLKLGHANEDMVSFSRRIRWEHAKYHSRHLMENMVKAGRGARPTSTAAHHVVSWSDARAARARTRLACFGIDIDHHANGVYLPRFAKHCPHPMLPNAPAHSNVHTPRYYLNVEHLLKETVAEGLGRRGIIDALLDMGMELQAGTFPLTTAITDDI